MRVAMQVLTTISAIFNPSYLPLVAAALPWAFRGRPLDLFSAAAPLAACGGSPSLEATKRWSVPGLFRSRSDV